VLEDVLGVSGHEVGTPEDVAGEPPLHERRVGCEIDVVAPDGHDERMETREGAPVAVARQEVRVQKIGLDRGEDPPHLAESDRVVERLPGNAGSDVVDLDASDRRGLDRHEVDVVAALDEVREPPLGVDVSAD